MKITYEYCQIFCEMLPKKLGYPLKVSHKSKILSEITQYIADFFNAKGQVLHHK